MTTVVLGAGIVGASVAYQLARDGIDVTIVDPVPPGRPQPGQATPAGAGIVFPWQFPDAPAGLQALGAAATNSFDTLTEQLTDDGVADAGYSQPGGMSVSDQGDELDAMARGLRWLRDQPGMGGIGVVERLGPAEPTTRFPPLRAEVGAVFASGIGQVDGRLLCQGLLQAGRGRGVQVISGVPHLLGTADRVSGVRVAGTDYPSDVVVVAAGAWSAQVCAPLGVQLPVAPQRGLTVHLQLPDTQTDGWPAVRGTGNSYLVAFPGGRVVAGASVEPDAGFSATVSVAALQQVLNAALALAPGLSAASVVASMVGFRPVTPDGLPLLGAIPGVTGLLVATGLGSQGLTYGPFVGELIARQIVTGQAGLPLEPYRPDRPAASPTS